MISDTILTKYHIGQPEDYETAADFYQTLLAQTDHIPNKIIEAPALGRAELNRLEV